MQIELDATDVRQLLAFLDYLANGEGSPLWCNRARKISNTIYNQTKVGSD